ncbi:MAG: 4Fe-4S dicluster domain-containing protein [Anaerolineae bacterium]|nr:4Fe-4S dicluster domain-containing protein [Anaerolineae bacterium]
MMPTNTFEGFLDLAGVDKPSDEIMNTCVRCGLCLQSCPTYVQLEVEPSSPRGRIALIRGVAEGRLPVDAPGFLHQMNECLGCLACQAVCPSGVQYGHLLEAGRAQAAAVREKSWLTKLIEIVVYQVLFMSPFLLRVFGRSMWLYQRTGVQALVRKSGILKLMGMEHSEKLLPKINDRFVYAQGQHFAPKLFTNGVSQAQPVLPKRVALLTGCAQSMAFAHVHEATIRTLRANGCEVLLPEGQQCCGALHAHGGDFDRARELARKNIDALEAVSPDIVVVNAAGCSHHLKEYAHLLHDDPVYGPKAEQFVAKSRDITELLAELGPRPTQNPLTWHVTYQEPCHLAHGQKVTSEPRQVLNAVAGLKLTEMKDSAMCCGSAGTYNITQPEMADKLLDKKLKNAMATGASIIATANTGCSIQLTAGLKDRQTPMPVMHIVEILDAGYRHDGLYADGTFDIPAEDDTQTKAIVASVLVLTLVLIGWVLKSLWKRK